MSFYILFESCTRGANRDPSIRRHQRDRGRRHRLDRHCGRPALCISDAIVMRSCRPCVLGCPRGITRQFSSKRVAQLVRTAGGLEQRGRGIRLKVTFFTLACIMVGTGDSVPLFADWPIEVMRSVPVWRVSDPPLPPPSARMDCEPGWLRWAHLPSSAQTEICLAPNDHLSAHVRRQGSWHDCAFHVALWQSVDGRTLEGAAHPRKLPLPTPSDPTGIILELGANIGACTLELLIRVRSASVAHPLSLMNAMRMDSDSRVSQAMRVQCCATTRKATISPHRPCARASRASRADSRQHHRY